MSPELTAAFNEKYPAGFDDYFQDLVKYTKPDGTPFYAVTIELPDSINLVKIEVKTDDLVSVYCRETQHLSLVLCLQRHGAKCKQHAENQ